MSRTDLIADSFTIIRNAIGIRQDEALIPGSKILLRICGILKEEGYIENFKEVDSGSLKQIKVYLRYDGKKSVITQLKKVSRSGLRTYRGKDGLPSVLNGYGIAIVSTSQGVLTDAQAREKGIGGEILGMVW
ncbi:MAG: 30S ribosomal protein S8 [Candidatus Omnitrophica bacterium]|nr:30S ribosomal protein S8 [Candidatus Omnitrophota bacterium]